MKKITSIYLGRKGGAVPYGFEMIKSLLGKGIIVQCILSELICNKTEWENLAQSTPSLKLIFLPTYQSKLGFFKDLFVSRPYKNVKKLIEDFNPDAIYLPMISLNARKFLNVFKQYPLITTIHDYTQHPGMENPITRYIFKKIELSSDKFVVLTSKYAPLLSAKYGIAMDHICHIPHANFSYYNNFKNEPTYTIKNNILFFGRISKYKGISVLLNTMTYLKHCLPNLRLTIVGNGHLDKKDLDIIQNNSDRICLINDWVPDSIVWKYFSDADITILPYIEASQSGVAALSFSSGRSVIATNVGGLEEQVLPAGGIIVPPNDPKILAESIIALYKSGRIPVMNKQAYKYAKEILSWDESAKRLIRLIYS